MNPELAVPLINTAADLATSQANRSNQEYANRQNQQWEYNMYMMQRKHRQEDWNLTNTYNSPQAQMQRLEDAGLNPALMYGSGGGGGGGVAQNMQAPSMNPVGFDVADTTRRSNPGTDWYNTKLQVQTLDNLEKEANIKDRQAALLAAQELKTLGETNRLTFDLGRDTKSLDWDLQAREAKAKGFILDNWYTEQKNTREESAANREAIRLHSDLKSAVQYRLTQQATRTNMLWGQAKTREDILNQREVRELMEQDQSIRQFEIEMNKLGLSKNDPYYIRMAEQVIEDIIKKARKYGKHIAGQK